ncbi:TetR/AcrR family transcriptional regulator [uncultured Ornithinimicrobium sp.]|uniref:TetR/AcrR family transcriptional regulator n=1 Tax=uncultured Ornithinimicrobium sp. TaxID=259307 RepID=UPI002597DECD|nr:helix-turn-helix domain-containing protein [uncultured Ornithinimicrobium sp.]
MSEPGLRETKRAATRRALARATFDLVRDRGFDAVTVADVTDRVGVSRRTFSNYFDRKEEAVAAVVVETVRDGLASWVPPPEADLLVAVRSLVDHQFSGEFPAIFAAMEQLCRAHPQLVPYWRDAQWRIWTTTGAHLRATMGLSDASVQLDLVMVMGALFGVVSTHFPERAALRDAAGQEHPLASVHRSLDEVFARLAAGLG